MKTIPQMRAQLKRLRAQYTKANRYEQFRISEMIFALRSELDRQTALLFKVSK